jgi:hypothetical protein
MPQRGKSRGAHIKDVTLPESLSQSKTPEYLLQSCSSEHETGVGTSMNVVVLLFVRSAMALALCAYGSQDTMTSPECTMTDNHVKRLPRTCHQTHTTQCYSMPCLHAPAQSGCMQSAFRRHHIVRSASKAIL